MYYISVKVDLYFKIMSYCTIPKYLYSICTALPAMILNEDGFRLQILFQIYLGPQWPCGSLCFSYSGIRLITENIEPEYDSDIESMAYY